MPLCAPLLRTPLARVLIHLLTPPSLRAQPRAAGALFSSLPPPPPPPPPFTVIACWREFHQAGACHSHLIQRFFGDAGVQTYYVLREQTSKLPRGSPGRGHGLGKGSEEGRRHLVMGQEGGGYRWRLKPSESFSHPLGRDLLAPWPGQAWVGEAGRRPRARRSPPALPSSLRFFQEARGRGMTQGRQLWDVSSPSTGACQLPVYQGLC